jgi:hypothetical protein
MTHVNFDELNDIAEGREPTTESREHYFGCGECQATVRRLRVLLDDARALPRDVAPPPEVWSALRDRVARRPIARAVKPRWWHNGWLAAAAALVLVIGTALLTNAASTAKAGKVQFATSTVVQPTPVAVASVERNYSATLAELRATLETQRTSLAPATVRTVERSLALIDAAIAEARAALATDPANQMLVDVLSANYERKVELLKRATELSSSL